MARILEFPLPMGSPTEIKLHFSVAPRRSTGFITDGKFLKFSSPYPQSGTKLYGGELSIDFRETAKNAQGLPKLRRFGELALMYYYGRSDDHFDESDLPLGDNPLAGLIRFSATRDSRSHFLMAEWRFPLFEPVYRSKHLRLVQPQYGLGVGGLFIHTHVTQDSQSTVAEKRPAFITGSTQLRVAEVSIGPLDLSFEASVRMLAGQTYGIMGETAFRLTYRR